MAARGSSSTSKSEPKETEAKVDDYKETPYSEVVSPEHREFLNSIGKSVDDNSETVTE